MSSLKWKRGLGRLWGTATSSGPRSVILLYHSLGTTPPAVTADNFRRQLEWVSENATVASLDDLLGKPEARGIRVAITFDDGYATLHDDAASILADFGAVATVFLNTGWIGETVRRKSDAAQGHYPCEHFLTWGEVDTLARAGWTIGSHGVDHLDLTRLGAAARGHELTASKQEIELRLGQPCHYFAYTWGRFSRPLQHAVQRAGYRSALSGLHGAVSPSSDAYALPRLDIRAEYELGDFADVLKGRWDYLGIKQRLARRLA